MTRRLRALALVGSAIAAVGTAVTIGMGHRPWYAWIVLVSSLGTAWSTWSVGRADGAPRARAASDAETRTRGP